MQVELRKIEEIKPYPKNPRDNDHAVEALAKSIREFGFRQPLVLDETGTIIVGDTRYKAACKLGLKKVPVHVAKGLTPEQIKAYRVADNKIGEIANWNHDRLIEELTELEQMAFNLDVIGFTPEELQQIWGEEITPGLCEPDAIPGPPDAAVTQTGDTWNLGIHRLMCGDAGNSEDVDRLVSGELMQLVNSDCPYNVGVTPRSNIAISAGFRSFPKLKNHQQFDQKRNRSKAKPTAKKLRPKDRPLANDFVSEQEFDKMLRAWFGNFARVLVPGGAFYLWGGYANCGNYPPALKAVGLYFSQAIIWVKEHPVLTRKDYMGNHEWCFYGWREGAAHRFFGPNNAVDVWSIKKINPQSMIHLTEKPASLAVRAIQNSSRTGDNVLDLFGGSGSTLIAAEQTGRRAFIMEIDALYCDVIVRRFEQFTGKKAERQPLTRSNGAPTSTRSARRK
jgi:DNA modification methylase